MKSLDSSSYHVEITKKVTYRKIKMISSLNNIGEYKRMIKEKNLEQMMFFIVHSKNLLLID